MSLAVNFVYPVTSWAYINEIPSLGDDRKEEILLVMQKADERTRSVIVPPCSVMLLESSLTFIFHSLSEDVEIVLYSSVSEILRVPVSRYQLSSDINIPIDYLESGSYTLEVITASGEYWCGYFEYVL